MQKLSELKMTKNDLLRKCWIPYTKRLPPDEDVYIVAWNYDSQTPIVGLARIIRAKISQIQRNPDLLKQWEQAGKTSVADKIALGGYKTSYWMYLPGPKGERG